MVGKKSTHFGHGGRPLERKYFFLGYDHHWATKEFNCYDRRMLASVLTTLAPYFDNDERMRILQQFRISTHSLSTYVSEETSERSCKSIRPSGATTRCQEEVVEDHMLAPAAPAVRTRSGRLPSDEITKPWFMSPEEAAEAEKKERIAQVHADNQANFKEVAKTTDIWKGSRLKPTFWSIYLQITLTELASLLTLGVGQSLMLSTKVKPLYRLG